MGRERQEFRRPDSTREHKRLFVIATEGEKTEVKYFGTLNDNYIDAKELYIETIPSAKGKCDPQSVINNLDEFKEQFDLFEEDQLWMVIDYDHWGEKKLKRIDQQCLEKGYYLAVSNPCFELWLLLHFVNVAGLDSISKEKLFENRKIYGSKKITYIESELKRICGSYNKANLNCSLFLPKLNNAVKHAKKLHTNDSATQRWPEGLGTFVYKLIEELLKK